MAVTLNGTAASTSFGTATTGGAVGMPAGIVAGELLCALLNNTGGSVSTGAPAGWSPGVTESIDGFGTNDTALFVRAATGTEGATQAFTWASGECSALVFRLGGASPTTPINIASAPGTATSGSLTAMTCPAVSTTVPNTMVIRLCGVEQAATMSDPAGHTPIGFTTANAGASGGDPAVRAAYQMQASIGTTGTAVFVTTSGSDRAWITYTLAIAPAAIAQLPSYTQSSDLYF